MNIPQDLNWVEKRAACTIAEVFNQLCDGIEKDVSDVNSIRKLCDRDLFRAEMNAGDTTMIVAQPKRIPRPRAFIGVDGDHIFVRQDWNGGEQWSVTVGLNDEGRCILRNEDQTEIEQWQLRKRALEGLFFGD
jgi:hypothetical protein